MKSNIHATSNTGTTSNCNVSSGSATTTSQILTVGNCTPISVTANPTTWGNTYTTANTYTGGFTTFTDYDSTLPFTDYLKEDELEKLLDIFQERMSKGEEDNFKCLIQKIVQRRHCSEDFLLKYLDKLRRFDIIEEHEKEITTREYSSLVRELELKEKYSRIKGYLD